MTPLQLDEDISLIGYKVLSTIKNGMIGGGILIDKLCKNGKPFDLKKGTFYFFAKYKKQDGNFENGFVVKDYFFPYNSSKKESYNQKLEKYIVLKDTEIKGHNIIPKGSRMAQFSLTTKVKEGDIIIGEKTKENTIKFKLFDGKKENGEEYKGDTIYFISKDLVKSINEDEVSLKDKTLKDNSKFLGTTFSKRNITIGTFTIIFNIIAHFLFFGNKN